MRRQLEGSYNIEKIISLEDEMKSKEKILAELQQENESLLKVQKEQEKALNSMNEGDVDEKISEISSELHKAKQRLRSMQTK